MQFKKSIFAIAIAVFLVVIETNSIPIERLLAVDSVGNVITIDRDNEITSTHPSDQCTNNFMVLEKALIYTRNNRLELIKTFYPKRSAKPVYVKQVSYKFIGKEENSSTLYVSGSWIWSSAAFYLIQPPSVFQYTSLFFSYYTGHGQIDEEPLSLYLPFECLNKFEGANWTSINNTCSDEEDKSLNPMLDILTQRLRLYAKYDPGHVIADEPLATVACNEDLEGAEYDNKHDILPFLSCVVGLPVLCIVILITIVRSVSNSIRLKTGEKSSHCNLAAIALTGLSFSIYVLVLDILALNLVLHDKHELGGHVHKPHDHGREYKYFYGLQFVFITFGIDVLPFLIVLLFCFYLFLVILPCTNDKNLGLKCCFIAVLYPVFGARYVKRGYGNGEDFFKECKIWLLLFCFISPLICFASHIGYLIVAWISNPQHAWSATLVTLFSVLYFYFMYRQLYIIFEKLDFTSCTTVKCGQCWHLAFCGWFYVCHYNCRKREYDLLVDMEKPDQGNNNDNRSLDFNFSAFFVSLFCGLFVTGIELYTAFAFIELPFSTETSPTYVLSVAELSFVVLATLVAYKILIINTPTEEKILNILNDFSRNGIQTRIANGENVDNGGGGEHNGGQENGNAGERSGGQ